MSMKKKLLIAGACVLAALCGAGIWFAPQIRSAMSIAQGAVMDEETRAEMEEENRRLEEELRNRYDVPQGEVNEDINAGVLDGTLSLEEAARQWLEQNGQTALPSAEGGTDAADDGSGADAVPPDGRTAAVENPGVNGTDAGDMTQEQKDQEAAEQKAAEQKAAEQKAAEQKAAEQKAAEQKAAEQKAAEQQAAEQKAAEEAAAKEAAEKAEKEARIQNLIAQAQVLRSVFTSRLDGVIAECKGEFMALPAEQQTTSSKVRIVTARLGEVADMEEECDGQVASIVSQLQELDPDTAAAVQDQYEREKLAKKTSLLNEYRNGPAQ